jgi:hypothetical protein
MSEEFRNIGSSYESSRHPLSEIFQTIIGGVLTSLSTRMGASFQKRFPLQNGPFIYSSHIWMPAVVKVSGFMFVTQDKYSF